jgi:hypothetical protein
MSRYPAYRILAFAGAMIGPERQRLDLGVAIGYSRARIKDCNGLIFIFLVSYCFQVARVAADYRHRISNSSYHENHFYTTMTLNLGVDG